MRRDLHRAIVIAESVLCRSVVEFPQLAAVIDIFALARGSGLDFSASRAKGHIVGKLRRIGGRKATALTKFPMRAFPEIQRELFMAFACQTPIPPAGSATSMEVHSADRCTDGDHRYHCAAACLRSR